MPEVLRQNAPPVANDFLCSAGLSPDAIDLVRMLVGHTIAAVECGLICETLAWRGGNRTHAANVLGISIRALRNKIHLYKRIGVSLPEPSRGLINGGRGDVHSQTHPVAAALRIILLGNARLRQTNEFGKRRIRPARSARQRGVPSDSHVLPNMQADAAAIVDGALRAALNKQGPKG